MDIGQPAYTESNITHYTLGPEVQYMISTKKLRTFRRRAFLFSPTNQANSTLTTGAVKTCFRLENKRHPSLTEDKMTKIKYTALFIQPRCRWPSINKHPQLSACVGKFMSMRFDKERKDRAKQKTKSCLAWYPQQLRHTTAECCSSLLRRVGSLLASLAERGDTLH